MFFLLSLLIFVFTPNNAMECEKNSKHSLNLHYCIAHPWAKDNFSRIPQETLHIITSELSPSHVWSKKQEKKYQYCIRSAQINRDNSLIIATTTDNSAYLISTDVTIPMQKIHVGPSITSACFNNKGNSILIACTNGLVRLINVNNDKDIKEFQHASVYINSVCFSSDETHIITAAEDGNARLYNITTNTQSRRLTHYKAVLLARENHDGSVLITLTDSNIYLWHGTKNFYSITLNTFAKSVCCNKNATFVLIASGDTNTYLWNINKNINEKCYQHNGCVNSACFNNNENLILTACADKTACLWDTNNNVVVEYFDHNHRVVNSAYFNNDETLIITAANDGRLSLWERYDKWTLEQIFFYNLLFSWLLVEKPQKQSLSLFSFIESTYILKNIKRKNLLAIWNTFPTNVQTSIWNRINRIIQKYGK